jgi:DNA mismatch repair protein MutS2
VRIIHGHGTGALRTAVREQLSRHSLVRAYSPESPESGGQGVTVVELA